MLLGHTIQKLIQGEGGKEEKNPGGSKNVFFTLGK
jgi:hypothetical protein